MRQISGWALQHKMAARVLIFLSYLLLNACAFLLGSTIDPLAAGITWLVALPFLIALLLYPERNRKSGYRNFYRTQKTCDLVLVACSFLLIVATASRYDAPRMPAQDAAVAAMKAPEVKKPGKKRITVQLGAKGFFSKHWNKIKTHVREIRAAVRNPGGAGKAALILLTIVVALALLYLVAALSCSIACSGAEGLAFTVALLGTGGVVFLTVVVIRRILHRRRRDPEPEVMLD